MSKFGWCGTPQQHSECVVQFENWAVKGEMIVCDCECHLESVS